MKGPAYRRQQVTAEQKALRFLFNVPLQRKKTNERTNEIESRLNFFGLQLNFFGSSNLSTGRNFFFSDQTELLHLVTAIEALLSGFRISKKNGKVSAAAAFARCGFGLNLLTQLDFYLTPLAPVFFLNFKMNYGPGPKPYFTPICRGSGSEVS